MSEVKLCGGLLICLNIYTGCYASKFKAVADMNSTFVNEEEDSDATDTPE